MRPGLSRLRWPGVQVGDPPRIIAGLGLRAPTTWSN